MNILELSSEETNWVRDAVAHERERLPDESEHYDSAEIDATLASAEDKLNDAIENRPVDEGIIGLFAQGCSPAEAIDYFAVEKRGISQSEWADRRNCSQQSISKNVLKANEKINK